MGVEYSTQRRKVMAKASGRRRLSQARGGPVVVRHVGEPVPDAQPPLPSGTWSRSR